MNDIGSICRTAWQSSKREHQPDYDDLVESYRIMLTARAEAVITAGAISGDAPFHPFENAVLSQGVSAPTDATPETDEPKLHVDEGTTVSVEGLTAESITIESPKPKKKPTPKPESKKPSPKVVKKAAKKVAPKK